MAAGKRIPPSIQRLVAARVDLHPHLVFDWEIFFDLNLRRAASFGGLLPLAVAEIEAYCRMVSIEPGEDAEELLWAVGVLDREYMTLQVEMRQARETLDRQNAERDAETQSPATAAEKHRREMARRARP